MLPNAILTYLDREGAHYQLRHHPRRIAAQRIAAVAHVPGFRLAKVVVLKHGDGFGLAVLPAPEYVDLARLARVIGGEWRLATELEMKDLFPDCEVGAMPALGSIYNMPVYVDACLASQDRIVFNAGTHEDLLEMPYADFARLTQPRVIDYGRM